jgi:hypothetical protein
MAILKWWIEFKELVELEKEEITKNSQGGSKHTIAIVDSSSGKQPTRRP